MVDSLPYSRTLGHIDWVHRFLPSLCQRSLHRTTGLPLGLSNMLPPLRRSETWSKLLTGSQTGTSCNPCRQRLLLQISLVHKRRTREVLVRQHHNLAHIPRFISLSSAFQTHPLYSSQVWHTGTNAVLRLPSLVLGLNMSRRSSRRSTSEGEGHPRSQRSLCPWSHSSDHADEWLWLGLNGASHYIFHQTLREIRRTGFRISSRAGLDCLYAQLWMQPFYSCISTLLSVAESRKLRCDGFSDCHCKCSSKVVGCCQNVSPNSIV